jgi:hypothetical protein
MRWSDASMRAIACSTRSDADSFRKRNAEASSAIEAKVKSEDGGAGVLLAPGIRKSLPGLSEQQIRSGQIDQR